MIGEHILARAKKYPDSPALTTFTPAGGMEQCSTAQLSALSLQMQASLENLGPNQAVVLEATSTPEAVAALIALEVLGRTVVLIPPALPALELREIVLTVQPGVVLRSLNSIEDVPVPIRRHGVVPGFRASMPRIDSAAENETLPLNGGGLVQMTSGSMGASRLAVRPFSGVMIEIEAVVERLNLRSFEGQALLCASSIAHSYGCIAGLLAPLSCGLEIALAADAGSGCMLMERTRPSIVVGLASTYRTVLDRADARRALGSAQIALSAGAPLPTGLYDAVLERAGVSIRQDYGTTETGTISIDNPGPAAPQTVGPPLSHVEIDVVPPADQSLEEGEVGEIRVRSAAMASLYLENGVQTTVADEDGWFHTRDVGLLDYKGRLVLMRRLRPLIDLRGETVRPEFVESVIAALPGVQEVVVLPGRIVGEPVLRAVVVAPGVSPEIIRDWCRAHLPVSQTPAAIEMREKLPRSPAGKVLQKYMPQG